MESMYAEIRASLESALLEVNKKKDDLQTLRIHAALYGYDIATNVPYCFFNGNCFFNAIAHQIAGDLQIGGLVGPGELRRQLVSFLMTKVNFKLLHITYRASNSLSLKDLGPTEN